MKKTLLFVIGFYAIIIITLNAFFITKSVYFENNAPCERCGDSGEYINDYAPFAGYN